MTELDVGYRTHLWTNLRDAAKWKSKKKLTKEI